MKFQPDDWSGGGLSRDAAANLTQAQDDDLEDSIVALTAHIDAAQAELALRIAEYDRRKLAVERHVLSTKQWLAAACRFTPRAASQLVRLGRSLSEMPGVVVPALSGEIPIQATKALTAVRDRHREMFASHGDVLIDAATYLAPHDLRRAIDHWEQQVHPGFAGTTVRQRREQRTASINQTFDGMWVLTGTFDPESGHTIDTTVHAIADPGNIQHDDTRAPGQRRADALVEACRFWLDHNQTVVISGGVKPHITVTVDYDKLAKPQEAVVGSQGIDTAIDIGRSVLPEIDHLPVSGETVRRLACDADIVRIITKGASEILDVGRSTRVIPGAIRRALDHRDSGCTWDGCDAPASWCDAHHIEHWADGGPTALANLRLLCRRHHRVVHDGEDQVRRRRVRSRSPDP